MKSLAFVGLIALALFLSLPSGFASVHVQIQNVQFQVNNSYLSGNVVIYSPKTLTIIVTLEGKGTVTVCPEQVVQYLFYSAGTGDNIGLMCDTINLNFLTTHAMQRQVSVSPNHGGQLYIRIHVLDARHSQSSEIATSQWIWICEIVNNNQS